MYPSTGVVQGLIWSQGLLFRASSKEDVMKTSPVRGSAGSLHTLSGYEFKSRMRNFHLCDIHSHSLSSKLLSWKVAKDLVGTATFDGSRLQLLLGINSVLFLIQTCF